MQVSEAIGNEAVFFGVSVLSGMGLVLLYDVFRIFRRLIPHGNIWIGIEDACYWLMCTVFVFLLLYQKNDGMLRAFCFLGIALGGAVYVGVLSRFVITICVTVFGWILKFLGKVFGTLAKPFVRYGKKILLFFRKWLKKVYKAIKIVLCKL